MSFLRSYEKCNLFWTFNFSSTGTVSILFIILSSFFLLFLLFLYFRYDKDRERRTERGTDKIGDFVDFMVFFEFI